MLQPRSGDKLTLVKLAGCDLQVVSLFELYGQNPHSPWHTNTESSTLDLKIASKKLEVAVGLEPTKTGFADQRLGLFGIATKNAVAKFCTQSYTQTALRTPIATPLSLDHIREQRQKAPRRASCRPPD
jgi:hypothetical protein